MRDFFEKIAELSEGQIYFFVAAFVAFFVVLIFLF